MDDFIGSKTLIPAERLRELNQRGHLRGALQLGSHLGAIACTSYALANTWGSYWMIPWFLLQGVLINYLYAGQHELSHWTVFKTRSLNNIFGHLFGFIVLMPREHDRLLHFQHHRFTQDPELDGELAGSPYFTLFTYVVYASGLGYWGSVITRMVKTAFGLSPPRYFTSKQAAMAGTEARVYLILYGLIALASWYWHTWIAVQLWILPMLTTKFIHQCQNLSEHTGMPNEPDILINTRTIKSSAILNWLAWNMPYHTAHHSYPAVPFYRLPTLHAEMVAAMGREPETIDYFSYQWHMLKKLWRENSSRYNGSPLRDY